jgi:hypothetical protein
MADDDRYFEVIRKAVSVCKKYKPKFGQGSTAGLSLDEFQELYQQDPFDKWFGLDSPLINVHRYFDDIKVHIRSLLGVLKPGARCFYVVGNSKFYDTLLPVEEIYAALFEDAGFTGVGWKAIRKRNSKKELFEYVVYASNPSVASRSRRMNGSRASR